MEAQSIQLERILGLSCQSNNSLSVCKISGDIFYAAGCCVVRYCSLTNRQKSFFVVKRAISCVKVSDDGQYLAIGERGHLPLCTVWNADTEERVASFEGHKHGVACVAFSPNSRYLVSIGFKHDRQLFFWNVESQRKISTQKLGNKVHGISFHIDGSYFVTCGDRHMKFWNVIRGLGGDVVDLAGKPGSILEDHKDAIFVNVACGSGDYSNFVYAISSSGVLCSFDGSRMMDQVVSVDCSVSYCLAVVCPVIGDGTIYVGCGDGICRVYSPNGFEYVTTLPLPAPLSESRDVTAYPACYAIASVAPVDSSVTPKIAAIFADKSLFVWDVADVHHPAKYRSFLFHRACVWDVHFLQDSPYDSHSNGDDAPALPSGTFVTCSADNSIRFWNLEPAQQRKSSLRSKFSREMLHMIEVGTEDEESERDLNSAAAADISASVSVDGLPNAPQSQSHQTSPAGSSNRPSTAAGPTVSASPARVGAIGRPPKGLPATPSSEVNTPSTPYSSVIRNGRPATAAAQSTTSSASTVSASPLSIGSAILAGFNGSPIDLSYGMPDTELPDRPQGACAPRALGLHPQQRQLACGDRVGVVRVYDLDTMKLLHSTRAHSAEVLTVHYSPPLRRDDGEVRGSGLGGAAWVLDVPTGDNDADGHDHRHAKDVSDSSSFVMLATAGRDRLVHIFDASVLGAYKPITTIDNHSSSVTVIKFSPDGQRLISCGGDRTIVFSSVSGPEIKRIKSIQTPHGTINGLSVEATNKFAITSGQDKRLNIWNLQSGKHMRAYKDEKVTAELYKTDIDPSGKFKPLLFVFNTTMIVCMLA